MNKEEYINFIINTKLVDENFKKKYIDRVESIKLGFPILISRYHLSSFFGIKWYDYKNLLDNINDFYRTYSISKKRGGKRRISIPEPPLKQFQKKIYQTILKKVIISDFAYGFVQNKSIYENAKYHIEATSMLSLDLKDFFPTIDFRRVYYIFSNLCGYCSEVSYDLTKMVTFRNVLPQGSPASPAISNIATFKLDYRLNKYAFVSGYRYSRYADDITFSSKRGKISRNFCNQIMKIIEDEGFYVNPKKTRISNSPNRLEITGLYIIDNQIRIPRKYISKIRQELYYIEKFGVVNHKKYAEIDNRFYLEHLLGKILFVKHIQPEKGIELLNKFTKIDESSDK